MGHNTYDNQRTEQIRGIKSNHHKPVNHKQKNQNHRYRSKQPQLLADNGENHIVLRLWHKSHLLDAFSQPFSHQTAGANSVKSLKHLKSAIQLVCLRLQPYVNTLQLVGL